MTERKKRSSHAEYGNTSELAKLHSKKEAGTSRARRPQVTCARTVQLNDRNHRPGRVLVASWSRIGGIIGSTRPLRFGLPVPRDATFAPTGRRRPSRDEEKRERTSMANRRAGSGAPATRCSPLFAADHDGGPHSIARPCFIPAAPAVPLPPEAPAGPEGARLPLRSASFPSLAIASRFLPSDPFFLLPRFARSYFVRCS